VAAIIETMRKPLLIAAAAALLLLLVGGVGAYLYFFSNLRSAPAALTLPTASPTSSPTVAASASTLAGSWTVAQGSQAGYRVTEQFVGHPSPNQAVARTTGVTGSVTAQQGSGTTRLTALSFTAQVAGLTSQDTVAGYNVSNRDRIVSQALSVSQYPTATFVGQAVDLPAGLESGQTVSLTIPGQLTIHGSTQTVQVTAQVKLNGSQVEVVGSTMFDMTQFGIAKPTQPFVTPQSVVTLEFQLVLVKS